MKPHSTEFNRVELLSTLVESQRFCWLHVSHSVAKDLAQHKLGDWNSEALEYHCLCLFYATTSRASQTPRCVSSSVQVCPNPHCRVWATVHCTGCKESPGGPRMQGQPATTVQHNCTTEMFNHENRSTNALKIELEAWGRTLISTLSKTHISNVITWWYHLQLTKELDHQITW